MRHLLSSLRRAHRRSQRGVATPLVVVLTAVLMVVTFTITGMGRLLVDQRKVAAAADLAALAGAVAVQHQRPGCEEARSVAARNGATLRTCTVDGETIRVEAVRPSTLLRHEVRLRATARAGPLASG